MDAEGISGDISNDMWRSGLENAVNFPQEVYNRIERAFLRAFERVEQKEEHLGDLSKYAVVVCELDVNALVNAVDSEVMICARKVHAQAQANWFGFAVGGAMMLVGVAVLPVAPVASGILTTGGFYFMIQEGVNAGNSAFSGVNF